MASKKDLYDEVERLNKKYCKNTKSYLRVSQAYGGYEVVLTGKPYNKGSKTYYRGRLGSGSTPVGNDYHGSIKDTLFGLYKADSKGNVKRKIKYWDSYK